MTCLSTNNPKGVKRNNKKTSKFSENRRKECIAAN